MMAIFAKSTIPYVCIYLLFSVEAADESTVPELLIMSENGILVFKMLGFHTAVL